MTPRTLRWRPDGPFWLDVAALEEVVELYRGDLLEGGQDEWLLDERDQLRQRWLRALERLAAVLAGRGDHAEAIARAEQLLRADPLHEQTYRLLMALHDARGDRARALRTYHACAAVLERELGVEPSAPTRRAYEALLDRGTLAPPDHGRGPAGPSAARRWSGAPASGPG